MVFMIVSAVICVDVEARARINSPSFLGFALRTKLFHVPKMFSMGLKKGEYGGKNIRTNGPPGGNTLSQFLSDEKGHCPEQLHQC